MIESSESGFEPDWSGVLFEKKRLVEIWRNTQREISTIQSSRLQMFIKGWFKE